VSVIAEQCLENSALALGTSTPELVRATARIPRCSLRNSEPTASDGVGRSRATGNESITGQLASEEWRRTYSQTVTLISRQKRMHTKGRLVNLMKHENTGGFGWVHCCCASDSLSDAFGFI
jgi:hypothetical protein